MHVQRRVPAISASEASAGSASTHLTALLLSEIVVVVVGGTKMGWIDGERYIRTCNNVAASGRDDNHRIVKCTRVRHEHRTNV